jgi:hypothetical protein
MHTFLRRLSYRRALTGLTLFLLPFLGGCRGPRFLEVTGVIKANGQPLDRVEVQLQPDVDQGTTGPRSWAVTDANGRFTLRADTGQSGARVGTYRVCLRDLASSLVEGTATPFQKAELPPRPPSRVLADYQTFPTTPLRNVVVEEGKTYDFDVAAKPDR